MEDHRLFPLETICLLLFEVVQSSVKVLIYHSKQGKLISGLYPGGGGGL